MFRASIRLAAMAGLVLLACAPASAGNMDMLESKVEGLVYMPDNFTLTIESADRMFGALVSAVTAPAEFRRANDGIS